MTTTVFGLNYFLPQGVFQCQGRKPCSITLTGHAPPTSCLQPSPDAAQCLNGPASVPWLALLTHQSLISMQPPDNLSSGGTSRAVYHEEDTRFDLEGNAIFMFDGTEEELT